jgi:SAM-dependent methyltransferase
VPLPPPLPNSPADSGSQARAAPADTDPATAEQTRLAEAQRRRAGAARDSWFDAAHRFALQDRERRVLTLLAREGFAPLAEARILDVGCGDGNWLRDLVTWGARPGNVFGVDLIADRVDRARRLVAPAVTVTQGDISALAYPDRSFDIVIQSTVFSSILDDARRRRTASEMRRVVRPTGLIVWYDFHVDNPGNADVRAVRRAEILRLFPGCTVRMERLTLAPPLARAVAPISTLACELLALLPPLRTHTLAAIRPA